MSALLAGWGLAMAAHAHFSAGTCTPQATLNLSIAPITLPVNPQVGQVIGAANGYDFGNNSFVMLCRYQDWPVEQPVSANMSVVNSPVSGRTFSASGVSMPVYATGLPGVGFAMMARDPGQPMRAISHTGTTLLTTKHNKPNGWGASRAGLSGCHRAGIGRYDSLPQHRQVHADKCIDRRSRLCGGQLYPCGHSSPAQAYLPCLCAVDCDAGGAYSQP
ncbi:hypothetical protein K2E95_14925 [Pseudomonas sp. ERGC3:01]|nr:hypothetical protein [Pseudomonas sp. ERGC3:01]